MFETRLTKFASENELSPDVVQDLIQIFNEALVEIGQGILNNTTKTQKTVNKTTTHIHKEVGQKWASKVAQGFAEEKELTLDDFPGIEKITKHHILELLKTKSVSVAKQVKQESPKGSTSNGSHRRKVQCNGLTAKGEPCTRTGTINPDGSQNHYCFRHADNWKDYETNMSSDSDSDDDVLCEEKPEQPQEDNIVKDAQDGSGEK